MSTYQHVIDDLTLITGDKGATWLAVGTLSDVNIVWVMIETASGDILAGTDPNGEIFRGVRNDS